MTAPASGSQDIASLLAARREATVASWQQALGRTGFTAVAASEVHRRLAFLTDTIIAALQGDSDALTVGHEIAAALGALHYVQPDDLGATLRVLSQDLVAGAAPATLAALHPRLTLIVSAVATAFAQVARDAVLTEQEEIRGALMTQREQARMALAAQFTAAERARSDLRAVLDASSDGMLLVRPDRRAAMVNARFEELLALPAAEVVGRTMAELSGPLEERFADSAILRGLADILADPDRQISYDLRMRYPEARELALYSAPVRAPDGAPLGRLHAFRDVTHEREVDRMKSQFVSLVSHELRTPLTSIKGYVDLLVAGDVGPLADDQLEFLRIVQQNADREVALITDLLDLSRMESGKLALERKPISLPHLLEQVSATFRPQLAQKRQQLVVELPDALPDVWGDAKRLMQVFTNLVSNAHKYTPVGGQITVRATVEHHQIIVAIEDTGIGLTAEEQAQLFTRFYRARNQLAVVVGGTGLGLAITRQLVELHGGTIGVQSAPGVGSTFRVALPAAPAFALADAAQPATGQKILVVEDEPAIAGLLRQYLERDGYKVLVAATGAEAFRLAQTERPALITLDLGLPDVDGFTVLEWLKQQPETAAIPVLILSATEDRERGTLLGSVDYLVKPVGQDALLAHVRTHLPPDASPLVLVVDDEADVRAVLGETLQRAGYRVIEAADGGTAIRLAEEQRPALLLMDVRMPGTDGLSTLRQIRATPANRGLPVIMLTASPGAREESWALTKELAISQVLQKPCPADVLVAVIADVVSGGS